ncbi:hypothetical protein HDU67_004245 [Dinochytrium kinnereticum]|nr:hypothetical protein HDU67_004245 [Dinochytrium kinnereticum]
MKSALSGGGGATLTRYPVASYWLAAGVMVLMSGLPPYVVEGGDLFWRVVALRQAMMGKNGTHIDGSLATVVGVVASVSFSDGMSDEYVLEVEDVREALRRWVPRAVAVVSAFSIAALIAFARMVESGDETDKGLGMRRRRYQPLLTATSCPSPTMSVSSVGSFGENEPDAPSKGPIRVSVQLQRRLSTSSSSSSRSGVESVMSGLESGGGSFDDGFRSDTPYDEETEEGTSPRRLRLSFKRVVARGAAFFGGKRLGVVAPRRLARALSGGGSRHGSDGSFRRFIRRWAGSSLGLHLAFHLLVGAPWAILAVEHCMGVAVVVPAFHSPAVVAPMLPTGAFASSSLGLNSMSLPTDLMTEAGASVVRHRRDAGDWDAVDAAALDSDYSKNINFTFSSSGNGTSNSVPRNPFAAPSASVSLFVAGLHVFIAVLLVFISMGPAPNLSNNTRPTNPTSSLLAAAEPLLASDRHQTHEKKNDDDRTPLSVSVVVDPYGVNSFATNLDESPKRGGTPEPRWRGSRGVVGRTVSEPGSPQIQPSQSITLRGDGAAEREDVRCFRFLNVVVLVVAALVMGLVVGWVGVCRESCGRKDFLEGNVGVNGTLGVGAFWNAAMTARSRVLPGDAGQFGQ